MNCIVLSSAVVNGFHLALLQELMVMDDASGRMNTVNPLTVQVVPASLTLWSQQQQQQQQPPQPQPQQV